MLKPVTSSTDWSRKDIGQKGVTLIELLLVGIILIILAVVVVLVVNRIQERGEENACKTEQQAVEDAAARCYADHDKPVAA